jgi:hypothetical protein
MRRIALSAFLCTALLLPKAGSAQLAQETYPPEVTAASAEWQLNGEPIFYNGTYYDAAGATIFFDGAVMSRTGVWKEVPLYQDRTLEPYTIVFVPIGGNVMKPYARRREDEPGRVEAERPGGTPVTGGTPDTPGRPASIAPTVVPVVTVAPKVPIRPGRLESVPAPTGPRGVFINYSGAKWFLEGEPVAYSANRFTPIGRYRGFPVYREKNGLVNRIWVAVVSNGPIAPYSKR